MNCIFTVQEMKEIARKVRGAGETIALVPTMGALHEGHLALVKAAAREATRVVAGIFVNPTQFGPGEDFERYPRDLESDLRQLATLRVDHVFVPDTSEMYPEGFQTRVDLSRLPGHLCGLKRTGHFTGVATVVLKLFNICRPDVAVFGHKDFQQIRVIERMVADLDLGVRIVRHETVREPDGLAMSSRNRYLSPEHRRQAAAIPSTLRTLAQAVRDGEIDAKALVDLGRLRLKAAGMDIEYVAICDRETLEDVTAIQGPVLIATAVRCGPARLIDNVIAAPRDIPGVDG